MDIDVNPVPKEVEQRYLLDHLAAFDSGKSLQWECGVSRISANQI
jgi:hypothetical protein